MVTKNTHANTKKAAPSKDGAQSARAQTMIESIDAVAKQIPEIPGSAAAARLSRRQMAPLVSIAQEYFLATAVALANWPELATTSKADPAVVRESIRALSALEGVVSAANALSTQVLSASERGWAATVQQCDRVLGLAKALLDNEEDSKRAEKIGKLVDAMKEARKIRRHEAKTRGKARPKANGFSTNGSTAKVGDKQITADKTAAQG